MSLPSRFCIIIMRTDIVFVLTSLLSMTEALRRQCRHNPKNWGEGWYYTVQGDTVTTIAADFCVHPDVIRHWTNIKEETLPPNFNLKLPCRYRRRDCRAGGDGYGAYTVVSGDTLNSIAADFCTNADVLVDLNKDLIKDKNFIIPDWVLKVPCSFNQPY